MLNKVFCTIEFKKKFSMFRSKRTFLTAKKSTRRAIIAMTFKSKRKYLKNFKLWTIWLRWFIHFLRFGDYLLHLSWKIFLSRKKYFYQKFNKIVRLVALWYILLNGNIRWVSLTFFSWNCEQWVITKIVDKRKFKQQICVCFQWNKTDNNDFERK